MPARRSASSLRSFEEIIAAEIGVVMARYILELEPFASLPVERIAETSGPHLQRNLTGDVPGAGLGFRAVEQSLMFGIVGDGDGFVDE